VGTFAEIMHGACTYETAPLTFLNAAAAPEGLSTGGNIVVTERPKEIGPHYLIDDRPLPRVTIHEILDRVGWTRIDILKLDCEASEYSILSGAPIERIGFIVGEYHGFDRWETFRLARFPDWSYCHISRADDQGNFHLRNDHFH
jgi:hypothetical protein